MARTPRIGATLVTPLSWVTVKYFAAARDLAGVESEQIDWQTPGPLHVLVVQILVRRPALAALAARSRWAVRQEYAEATTLVHPGDEVALLPPVSGG